MSDDVSKKDMLIQKAVDMGLGDDKFLSKISEENLQNMVSLVESKDGDIANLKAAKSAPEDNPKVIRVSNLVKEGRIGVINPEPEAAPAEEETADPDEDE